MAVKATELGKTVILPTGFDLSAKTSLEIKTTSSDGATVGTIVDARITIPATPFTDPDTGEIYPSETYMKFLTASTDFLVEDTFTLCGTYTEGSTKKFFTDDGTLVVEAAC